MSRKSNPNVPPHIIQSLDASLADVAAGRIVDAASVQSDVRQMLAEYERSVSENPKSRRAKQSRAA